jgi:hypothetical protein
LAWLVRGIYRTGHDPAAEAGIQDPWMATLPGRFGLIYPFGRDRLAVEVSDPRIASRVAAALDGAEPHQRGWWFWAFTFPVARLGAVVAVIQPKKVRRLSAAAKKRLVAINAGTRFGVSGTVLNPSSERQDTSGRPEVANGSPAAAGAVGAFS